MMALIQVGICSEWMMNTAGSQGINVWKQTAQNRWRLVSEVTFSTIKAPAVCHHQPACMHSVRHIRQWHLGPDWDFEKLYKDCCGSETLVSHMTWLQTRQKEKLNLWACIPLADKIIRQGNWNWRWLHFLFFLSRNLNPLHLRQREMFIP